MGVKLGFQAATLLASFTPSAMLAAVDENYFLKKDA